MVLNANKINKINKIKKKQKSNTSNNEKLTEMRSRNKNRAITNNKKSNKHLKIILVGPKYQINLGYMARVLKNFGINEMNLVGPRCNYKGKEAIKYSKHAKELLLNAKVYDTIEEAIKGCDIVFGSTGAWYKCSTSFFNLYTPKQAKLFSKSKKNIAILIGRDDIGLTKEELKLCDGIIFIPSNTNYSVLNISHALAIILYEFLSESFEYMPDMFYAEDKDIKNIIGLFNYIVESKQWIRNKEEVVMAFKHILKRSNATTKEINAITVGLSQNNPQKQEKRKNKKLK
ncbi:MAG: RNA methyltransferase [Candidatus Micrarchaeia archaeon]